MQGEGVDDGTLRHVLEQSDGNVEEAVRAIKTLSGGGDDNAEGYKLDIVSTTSHYSREVESY